MKITSLDLPASLCDAYQLKPVKMSRLGDAIVLAGRNGAGKTRFLKLLKDLSYKHPGGKLDKLKEQYTEKEKLHEAIKVRRTKEDATLNQKRNQEINMQSIALQMNEIVESMVLGSQLVIEPDVEVKMIPFLPKSIILTDSIHMSQSQIETNLVDLSNLNNIGTDSIEIGVIPTIHNITKNYISATHIKSTLSEREKKEHTENYHRLNSIIKKFLNVELEFDSSLIPTLFRKRIGGANLSQGQIILLQLALAIYAQGNSIDNYILLIDEPENHLYPKALLEALDIIMQNTKNGQVWITTHSIHVLAHFDPSSIWYIEDGDIRYAGNVPHKVLDGLLGSEEEKVRLINFLSLPDVIAFNQFSYECLHDPKVLLTGIADPQVKQAHQILLERIQSGEKLKVMDIGIGQGRFLSTIDELEKREGRSVADWLDYYGYDISDTYKDNCNATLDTIYSDDVTRYFNDNNTLLEKLDKGTFDLVIMSNVLHEIDPKNWIEIFKSQNSICSLLKQDGYLLIIEDQLLPVGELAHANGFLVLDGTQLKSLFNVKTSEGYFSKDYKGDGRLKAHFIPASHIKNIDDKSRKESIISVRDEAAGKIREIRSAGNMSFQNGRLLAFWTQQLANATLVIQELGY